MKQPLYLPKGRRGGVTLVELLLVVSVLVIALGELARSMLSVSRLGPANRETSVALQAVRSTIEELRELPFEDVFATVNSDTSDDPDGPGTARGMYFQVSGLDLKKTDLDGYVGHIELPVSSNELREDYVDSNLGTPRDLNGDGSIDGSDHSGDYDVLPIRVVVEWKGAGGDRRLTLTTTLAEGM